MDGSRTSRRRHLSPVPPSPEALEGRRLMAANAAQVRIQEVTTNGANALVITGTRRADVISIADTGGLGAGNVTVTLADGTAYTSKKGIATIQVLGGPGNDRVDYRITGDLMAARSVNVSLGVGNDVFTSRVDGAIRTTGVLDLQAYGDSGNDSLSVLQNADTVAGTFFPFLDGGAGNDALAFTSTGNVALGAAVGPVLNGGAGDDSIALNWAGQVKGKFLHNLTISGGGGRDRIAANLAVRAGSTGTIGVDGTTTAIVKGDAGNDQIRYSIALEPGVAEGLIHANAIGNGGRDFVQRSRIVQGDASNETEAILS